MNAKLFELSARLRNASRDAQDATAGKSIMECSRLFGAADAYLNAAEWVCNIIESDIAEAELEAIRRGLDTETIE